MEKGSSQGGYRVYVIELSEELCNKFAEKKPCVYVGQSWHPPDVRFAQHKAGVHRSPRVQKYGVRLLPELYEGLPTYDKQHQAERAERRVGNKLKHRGYRVFGPQLLKRSPPGTRLRLAGNPPFTASKQPLDDGSLLQAWSALGGRNQRPQAPSSSCVACWRMPTVDTQVGPDAPKANQVSALDVAALVLISALSLVFGQTAFQGVEQLLFRLGSESKAFNLVAIYSTWGAAYVAIYLATRPRDSIRWPRWEKWRKFLPIFIGVLAVSFVSGIFGSYPFIDVQRTTLMYVVSAGCNLTIIPLSEEFLFRGAIWDFSQRVFSFRKSGAGLLPLIITSALFGLQHWQYMFFALNSGAASFVISTGIFGLFVGFVRRGTGSVWPGVLLHSTAILMLRIGGVIGGLEIIP